MEVNGLLIFLRISHELGSRVSPRHDLMSLHRARIMHDDVQAGRGQAYRFRCHRDVRIPLARVRDAAPRALVAMRTARVTAIAIRR